MRGDEGFRVEIFPILILYFRLLKVTVSEIIRYISNYIMKIDNVTHYVITFSSIKISDQSLLILSS